MATLSSAIATAQGNGKATVSGHGLSENLKVTTGTCAVTTALALGDVVNFFYLPAGATIRNAMLRASNPLDSNGSPTLTIDVGDAGQTNRIYAASLAGSSATGDGYPVFAALSYQYTAPTLIFATVHAAGATKVAGTLLLTIDYTIEGAPS